MDCTVDSKHRNIILATCRTRIFIIIIIIKNKTLNNYTGCNFLFFVPAKEKRTSKVLQVNNEDKENVLPIHMIPPPWDENEEVRLTLNNRCSVTKNF